MRRKLLLSGVWVLVAALSLSLLPALNVQAQDGEVTTAYQLNMRAAPDGGAALITTLPAGTPLVLEARNADTSWVLGHTTDNAHRGWLSAIYLSYPTGYAAVRLPVSTEAINAAAPASAPAESAPPEADPAAAPAAAPGGIGATTGYTMNVRSGPGTAHSALGQIAGGTGIVLEARNADASWVLFHTPDNATRGWLASLYLNFSVSAASLPVSDEIITPAGAGAAAPGDVDASASYGGIDMGGYDPARVEGIDLAAFPVVGRATGNARAIFAAGQALGNQANVVTTVGDCSSEHWSFLTPFAWGEYNLGGYSNLEPVVAHFRDSLGVDSIADHNGFNANAVLAPEWAPPGLCQAGESPLLCEYRVRKPAAAVIMFGTSDLIVMSPSEFDFYMREIVRQSIDAGVIPILSTFPGNLGFWDKTIFYNQIVVRVALDFDVPLINLWLALEALPNHGLEPDGFHLGQSAYGTSCYLTQPHLSSGYPVRNLVTMQTLDAVWRGAMW